MEEFFCHRSQQFLRKKPFEQREYERHKDYGKNGEKTIDESFPACGSICLIVKNTVSEKKIYASTRYKTYEKRCYQNMDSFSKLQNLPGL